MFYSSVLFWYVSMMTSAVVCSGYRQDTAGKFFEHYHCIIRSSSKRGSSSTSSVQGVPSCTVAKARAFLPPPPLCLRHARPLSAAVGRPNSASANQAAMTSPKRGAALLCTAAELLSQVALQGRLKAARGQQRPWLTSCRRRRPLLR